MRTRVLQHNEPETTMLFAIFALLVSFSLSSAYPVVSDDDRFADRDLQYASPGAHQLASWLTAQLRRNDYPSMLQQEVPVLPYRLPGVQGKRNSELTNSMMGIPRNMIDNGRK